VALVFAHVHVSGLDAAANDFAEVCVCMCSLSLSSLSRFLCARVFVGEYSRSPFLSDRIKSSSKQNFKFKFVDGMYRVAKMHKMP